MITAVATTEAFAQMQKDMPVLPDASLSVVSVAVTQPMDSTDFGPTGPSDSFKIQFRRIASSATEPDYETLPFGDYQTHPFLQYRL